ncbi:MAG TPA: lactate utilization protein [Planctomycetes bacterium]|nr:lactate utilization protein [Fuerstiella sp.]HIK94718.1 lactate utilization protein [Planctomycetota bacterium]
MPHPRLAKTFTDNKPRAQWHDKALWFVREKRDRMVSDVPEWEDLRQYASAIKMHTMSRLPHFLEQFETNARALGVHVHWAVDGDEHNRIVHDILKQHNVQKIVKSKSMLTEECHLNPFLERHGYDVVDTDLGERIVQLRNESPSHIVLPAIHIKKEEVGECFHEHLGTEEGASDPAYLTEAARNHLRERFCSADAGITGVNFAIAETGGFVVCTNEGNADLGVSLPKLHIACMGIEKLLPRASDLAVFLRLLARSATGQPITTYSSHFHGPREGSELHIILLDNGRSGILASPEFRRSLNCIRCGACMNTCPVYRRSGGHSYESTVPGPIGSILTPLSTPEAHSSLPFACTLCGSCTDVCPVKIDLHHQLLAMRGFLDRRKLLGMSKKLSMKFLSGLLSSTWLYTNAGKAARTALRWLPRFAVYNPLNGWGRQRDLPDPPRQSFREQYATRQRESGDK